MSTSHYNEKKFTWCLSTYGTLLSKQGVFIKGIRECSWGCDCHNAHSIKEISLAPDIQKWNNKSKDKIDLLQIKENILCVFNKDRPKVKNPKYLSKLHLINEKSFKDLLDFWFDIACYHRKIFKFLKKGEKGNEGYYNMYDVPKFNFDNEDDVWSLQRTFNMCEQHHHLCNNPKDTYYIKNICVGHYNCKKGVHRIQDLACIDDMIKGDCNCKTEEQLFEEKNIYLKEIESIQKMFQNTDREFSLCLSKSKEKQLRKQLAELNSIVTSIGYRKVHYTEQGLIPLDKRIQDRKETEPEDINIKINQKKVLKLKKK
jgi:hypothetical protein